MNRTFKRLACAVLLFGAVASLNAPKANAVSRAHTFCQMPAVDIFGPDIYYGTCDWEGGVIVAFYSWHIPVG